MKKAIGGVLVLSAVLSGCGGDSHNSSGDRDNVITVDALANGNYTVSVGDAQKPTIGKYYVTGDRSYLVLDSDDRHAQRIYRRSDNKHGWVAVPTQSGGTVTLLNHSAAAPQQTITPLALAATYTARIAGGSVVTFSISTSGTLTTSSAGCQLSGEVTAGVLPGTADITLRTTNCGLPAQSSGVLLADSDYRPVAFRLLADDGSTLVELWAYAN